MKIIEALKTENIRLSTGNKWLIWDGLDWVVYEHIPHGRYPRVRIKTPNEDDAVAEMVKE